MTLINQFFINTTLESEDRFDMGKLLEYTEDNYDVVTSHFLEDLTKLPNIGNYLIQNEVGRPELVSFRVYGNVQYWWLLLMYNGIMSSDDLVTGTIIKFPSLESLEDLFFSMKAKENSK